MYSMEQCVRAVCVCVCVCVAVVNVLMFLEVNILKFELFIHQLSM